MNFLVHFFLADKVGGSFTGQLLGDFIKGRAFDSFDQHIRSNIIMHRKIDSFSDAHPITKNSRNRFGSRRRRFAGVIVDICYDHFLAKHWSRYTVLPLKQFAKQVYADLNENAGILPEDARFMVCRMADMDWLSSYASLNHVAIALDRIAARLTNGHLFKGAIEEISKNYSGLKSDFFSFFPDLLAFSENYVLLNERISYGNV